MKLEGAYIRDILHICAKDTESRPLKVNIPYYQRPYQWGEKEISNLVRDFEKNLEVNKEDKSYFVGAVVLVSDPNRSCLPDLIDGQQRVTTVFLLNYIKYLFLMPKIDVLLEQHSVILLQKEMERWVQCYGRLVGTKKVKEFQELAVTLEEELTKWLAEQDEGIIDSCRKKYKTTVGLPMNKDLSNMELYLAEWKKERASAMKNEEFAIQYSRASLNHKLAEALESVAIVFSSSYAPEFQICYSGADDIVKQYMDAMGWMYNALTNTKKVQNAKTPLEKVSSYIEVIDDMLDNLEFCVIVSQETDDAYTLFEVLNDRACKVSDISLIKNQYLKRYCLTTKDLDKDDHVEKMDKLWGTIFDDDISSTRVSKISYFATVYLTGNQDLDNKNDPKFRYAIENYLEQYTVYSFEQLQADIKVYEMIRVIVKDWLSKSKDTKRSIISENVLDKSITYRTLQATNAFGYDAVSVALVCLILKKYMELKQGPVVMEEYRAYLNRLFGDKDHTDMDFADIHDWFFEMWKVLFLAKDHACPRKLAQDIISKASRKSETFPVCSINSQLKSALEEEFDKWFEEWKYSSNATDKYRVKVLLLHLMHTQKEEKKLVYKEIDTVFQHPDNMQLDHLDAQNPQEVYEGAYYEPGVGKTRGNMIQGIGNMMILDQTSNNSKDNLPLQKALKFYSGFSNHWMVTEIIELLGDETNHKKFVIGKEEIAVPMEAFFIERKQRLKGYFKAILNNSDIKNKDIPI